MYILHNSFDNSCVNSLHFCEVIGMELVPNIHNVEHPFYLLSDKSMFLSEKGKKGVFPSRNLIDLEYIIVGDVHVVCIWRPCSYSILGFYICVKGLYNSFFPLFGVVPVGLVDSILKCTGGLHFRSNAEHSAGNEHNQEIKKKRSLRCIEEETLSTDSQNPKEQAFESAAAAFTIEQDQDQDECCFCLCRP
ncbi:hypothetical protein MAR_027699 [Mya arenaria]|uniref:Uncharacterized protein n=1 Tax=Mya arenaria TaxID=6604 RepID=A0ABY7EYL3_MYAAR|nr:hypothetical protein MAR_027699 [Mya arenaria]